jgi:Ca2+-binding RTX toxin-like protein
MDMRVIIRTVLVGLGAMALIAMIPAAAASNSVLGSNLDQMQRTVARDDIVPSACDGLDLDELIADTGVFSGTAGNDLLLGGPDADVIDGTGGDDCIVGGGGDDTLIGGDGQDVCVGGPGSDEIDLTCE